MAGVVTVVQNEAHFESWNFQCEKVGLGKHLRKVNAKLGSSDSEYMWLCFHRKSLLSIFEKTGKCK